MRRELAFCGQFARFSCQNTSKTCTPSALPLTGKLFQVAGRFSKAVWGSSSMVCLGQDCSDLARPTIRARRIDRVAEDVVVVLDGVAAVEADADGQLDAETARSLTRSRISTAA